MKKLALSLLLSCAYLAQAQSVGINTTTPHASAALDVTSTTQGMLIPRMTQAQRNLIGSPATGLLVYQTDNTPGFYFYNGTAWTSLSGGGSSYTAGTGISIAGNVISNTGDNDNSSTNEIELPSQAGNSGKYLTTDGTSASWATVSGGGGGGSTAPSFYGDGSAGSIVISSNTDWVTNNPGANLQFSSFTVNSGATLTIPSGMMIKVAGNVTINGTITVSPATGGFATNSSPHFGVSPACPTNVYGGRGLTALQAVSVRYPVAGLYGGGAGSRTYLSTGAEGGGYLLIAASGSITIGATGIVNVNGGNCVSTNTAGQGIVGGGGGAGGILLLASNTSISLAGTLKANGGNGGDGFDGNGGNVELGGGGGGGGIIHLMAPSISNTGTLQVNGGTPGNPASNAVSTQGHGGGACGGNGGNGGGFIFGSTFTPSSGSAGQTFQTIVTTPANLFY